MIKGIFGEIKGVSTRKQPNLVVFPIAITNTVMNPQKAKFLRELMLPYHETVRKIGNPKVSSHEKRKLLQKAQVGEGVLESVSKYLE